jgi:very-short-patch-repair endonuclease
MSDNFPAILASQSRTAADLRDRRSALDGQVTPEGLASAPSELERIANTLETAGLLQRMFSGEFKHDRRTAERALGSLGERADAAVRLRVLAKLLEDERNFESSPARPFFAEGLWQGSASDWDSLAAARSLAERTYDRLAKAGLDGLVSRILDASALELRASTVKATALAPALSALPASKMDASFAEMLESVDQRATALERLAAALGALDIADDATLRDGSHTIADSIREFRLGDAEFRESRLPASLSWASDPESDASALAAALDYRSALHPDVLAMLEKSGAPGRAVGAIRAASADLMSLHSAWTLAGEAVESFIETDVEKLLDRGAFDIGALASAADLLAADEAGLRLAADLHRYIDEASKQGCQFIVELGAAGELESDKLSDFYELLVSRAILGHYLKGDGESLKRLGGMSLEAIRSRFREIDRNLQDVEAKRIVAERLADRSIWGRDSGPKGSWTERALIDNELSKKKRHIPIRDLTKRAGRALQSMKPVWMMSPSSVAQYVQPATVTFDLVVIDEASQMRPEYAVSSILRGRQLVVVGDSRQLPPTDFFQTSLSGMDGSDGDGADEETLTVDTESILDLANSRIGTRRQLNWHYRSRHESLIQFSNRQFYDRRLVVFPSPDTDDPLLGVKHVFVGGTYDASINQEEAEAVIRDAIGLMITHPECSMGIATMNIKQTDLIKSEFDRLAGEQEAVRNYIAAFEGGIDRFFIKNLENVQGDERDIILISTVYGPDKDGRVMQRFGPIASDVGHRRLNVLVTRARLSTRVYTSLRSGDIKITETSKPGTVATQAYLTFAEGGARFDVSDGGEADSDFEVFVADRLRAAGFEVIHQVGVEKFRIDLGVRHPDYPLGFIAGIECDGATYHSGFTVRDRDKIRQSVLEGLGWNIYRIWSTDWFTDPDREAAKLIAKVMQWRDESIAKFAARHASGEFQTLTPPPHIEPEHQHQRAVQPGAANDQAAEPTQELPTRPREIPEGRKRELDGIDWYEVETATLYEIWPDGEYGGEVEVLSRAMGAPQIYGGSVRIPKSEYRGTVDATGITFIENDIYAAVRKVGRLAREARQ